jgi:hypothetical protein
MHSIYKAGAFASAPPMELCPLCNAPLTPDHVCVDKAWDTEQNAPAKRRVKQPYKRGGPRRKVS